MCFQVSQGWLEYFLFARVSLHIWEIIISAKDIELELFIYLLPPSYAAMLRE